MRTTTTYIAALTAVSAAALARSAIEGRVQEAADSQQEVRQMGPEHGDGAGHQRSAVVDTED